MKVFEVKHSALLRQPEHFISRSELKSLIHNVTDNLVNIEDKTGEFLLRLDDGRVIDTKGWAGWEWTHGIGLYGIYQYYQQTGDEKMRAVIDDWFTARLAEGTPTKNVNTMSPFLTLAYRYEETGNAAWRPYLERWAEWVMYEMPRTDKGAMQHIVYNNENHQQMWDDTLMMSVLPLAKIGKLLDRPEFVEEATYQFLMHVQYLMDRETGLWFHGWTFDGHHNFAQARWARGNSWLTIAIPEFLELVDLPENNATRRYLLQVLESQVSALAKCQDDSGLWHTLLDDPQSYLESSATAGFAYGILKAVRKRYIDASYAPVAEKAIQGVIKHINPAGELTQTSFGTAMGNDLDFYREIALTSMPYGQAMAILCLSEYMRVYL
ncbi:MULTISPECIES: glycoside hydrolase family 105 protein [Rahnella]|jgi:unsaturated rhamnogalacturonyl hydrolase|uniref:Glycoside hydrolase family 88 protein n=1 Tax=Rahnella victoriana TaxID=1510570 RepID=A0ABS0DXV5_9GAMM|nr:MULTISPECIES: glycoside hydrolase family 88 protein [Rahnella]VTQ65598.1 Unsaturated rhamnogalacturonyl hydrolase YesR [Campylobacter jejuni]MBF7958730.1 glycoside hydrolase family 88 protein [Rahnella victoriana]TBX33420.1 glycoside hydrolase family 105 protein [Rahnella victoriana]TDS86704.1 unsaturated rhamnogalacturonyl hydrolase [Rahnella sp. BIGb0236]UHM92066.1 glycoside hydrolase family 88 protein [Rahnella victoriana]